MGYNLEIPTLSGIEFNYDFWDSVLKYRDEISGVENPDSVGEGDVKELGAEDIVDSEEN